jgi:hypothetical protein
VLRLLIEMCLDEEIKVLVDRGHSEGEPPLVQMFRNRVTTYYSKTSLGRNSKPSKARNLYKLLREADFDLVKLSQKLNQTALTDAHLNQLKMCIRDTCNVGVFLTADQKLLKDNILSSKPKTDNVLSNNDLLFRLDDLGNCEKYDESLCAKFVAFFMQTTVIRMIKEARRFAKGFESKLPKTKSLQRWKATIAGLLLYVFPLRNSTVELISPKETSGAVVFEDVAIFKFKDSKRTAKLLLSKSRGTRSGKDAARVEVVKAAPIWLLELMNWYIEFVRPHLLEKKNFKQKQNANNNKDLYACSLNIQDRSIIPIRNISGWSSKYFAKRVDMKGITATYMRTFFAHLSSLDNQSSVSANAIMAQEHTEAVKQRHYNIPGSIDAKTKLSRYLQGLVQLMSNSEEESEQVTKWFISPFPRVFGLEESSEK